MAFTAAGFSGNQWNAIPLTTASKASSGTGISWTPATCRSASTPSPSSFSRNRSSMPSEGSTPVTKRVPNRATIASVAKPVPQPTSSTRSYRPGGSEATRRSEPPRLRRSRSS